MDPCDCMDPLKHSLSLGFQQHAKTQSWALHALTPSTSKPTPLFVLSGDIGDGSDSVD